MDIQWFPGHMAAARKKAAETLARTDVVIEVVDARLPEASTNPMIDALRRFRQRPCLKILNKADLADPQTTKAWLDWYGRQPGIAAVALSCRTPADVARIPKLCLKLAPGRGLPSKPLRMMIMGIPNVGKSTLMNALLRRRVAAVGDEPAITKSQQRLELNDHMVLVDTPGMLWPRIEFPSDGLMLAASHAVGRNALYEDEVAQYLAELLSRHYPLLLAQRYGIDPSGLDGVALIEAIARRRGFRMRGGDLDLEKAAMTLLQDYRSGTLGRISLETPESRARMIEQSRAAAAQAAAAKTAATPDEPGPSV